MEKLWAAGGRPAHPAAAFDAPMLRRVAAWTALAGAAVLAGALVWLRLPTTAAPTTARSPPPAEAVRPAPLPVPIMPRRPAPVSADCAAPSSMTVAAGVNAATLATAAWSPSGPPETGWAAYAPLAAREAGVACPASAPAFAAALSRWRVAHHLVDDGVMDEATLKAMVTGWLLRRPFVQATRAGGCPASPDESLLAQALPGETLGGKPVRALPAVLEAWRRMRAAARAEAPEVGADPKLLAIASGWRGPLEEAARCALGGCGGAARARCSAHRTGTALDMVLDTAPGARPLSTAQADRDALARTPAYLWLVANADRFGFLPYAYEPWHWEWAGLSSRPAPPSAGRAPAAPPPSP